ncbi:extracellular glycine-rich protein [Aspergillus nomiae NRRL 13137]|uniref:Extracellular glycine-rich protein n=1 Tax=Aspergillus nomiae NRRL (strain ATCC 15546 / NRRL 13137 / CBS 260.88 / M93) TaxID=1509407 RepID=A0A0L1INI2_ASPN3|nr:extracellular glycine-rich protein [Aspergillus nomiae NRRL 13137]KNG80793.1 extracellular glycine-rich protein [Aspergillus nomiae NRRL 13137]
MKAFVILTLVTSILAAPTQTLERRQPNSVIPSAPSEFKALAAPAPSAPPQASGGQSGGGCTRDYQLISTVAGAAGGGGGDSGKAAESSGGGGGDLGDLTKLIGEGLIGNAAGGLGSIGNLLGGLGGLGGLLRRDVTPEMISRAMENIDVSDLDDDECIIEKLGGMLPGEAAPAS